MAEKGALLSTCCTVQLFTEIIKVREIPEQKENGAHEDNTDPYKNWVNSGASEMLAVPAILFIVNHMYIEYSGLHSNCFSQEDTHYNIQQYFQDITGHNRSKLVPFAGKKFRFIIFIKNKIKKFRSPPHYCCLANLKNKNCFQCGLSYY